MRTLPNSWFLFTLIVLALCLPSGPVYAEQQQTLELQRLLDQAKPGDRIVLQPGTYEGPITINKSLTLQSAEPTGEVIVRNSSEKPAITLKADRITIAGLRIVDEAIKESASILVLGNRSVLDRLQIRTGAHGIEAKDAHEGSVNRTTIEWAVDDVRMAEKGNGIDLFNAHRWRMTNNTIREVHDGIYMENSDEALVAGNVIERSRYGIHCMYTKRTVIQHNEGKLNVTGAMVMAAEQVVVTGNTFSKQSENVNSQGVLLYDAHETMVSDNKIDGNRVGLYVEQSTANRVERNQVGYNFVGIQLLESSENTITSNQFLGNVTDAQARDSDNNTIASNYWDSFRGIDTNGDGNSEISYAINPFFQGLTRKRAAFQLFFQSPGMVFLEGLYQTERIRWTTDSSPLMRPHANFIQTGQRVDKLKTGLTGLLLIACASLLFYKMRRQKI
ncbi:right-handed parallel beta-helix repeat-containing protein [Paenibacillus sp. ACRRX]|uniref:right-handed parallel beta-helix repeat-containing protein n=1 Tax=Paenibacillus sp. ACRRX TaxID=2918206 RepID=UPI001EF5AC46|nr:NosD domain-containing protein [Paenibacillus sp. ACRRX]MCG7407020.1 right-handed parallel beta-helix repeat-containing protein [Paenibacillus sp. ACRRX]